MTNELFFNEQCADTTYGVVMAPSTLASLMTPPAAKQAIQSECRLEHGTRTVIPQTDGVRLESRQFTIEVGMRAPSAEAFNQRYNDFIAMLTGGWVSIRTKYQPGVVYHCRYISTTTFSHFNGRIAKMVVKFEEPNPANRT